MTISELVEQAYENSKSHGFHGYNPTEKDARLANDGLKLALIHSEVSEVLEELRSGREPNELYFVDGKPEGAPAELADIIIRIADYAGLREIDLEEAVRVKLEYNASRPYKHGREF